MKEKKSEVILVIVVLLIAISIFFTLGCWAWGTTEFFYGIMRYAAPLVIVGIIIAIFFGGTRVEGSNKSSNHPRDN